MNVARLRTYPQLGRVSNLPTIATQAAAAIAVAADAITPVDAVLVATGLASAYVAGMFLNDAFDRTFDARHRPDRPIPAGLIDVREVYVTGAALLAIGVALLAVVGFRRGHPTEGLAAALALAAAIVIYDAWHKGNPIAPVLMGSCRALVYVSTGFALGGRVTPLAAVGALSMFAYVVGLSEVARSERAPARAVIALGLAPMILGLGLLYAEGSLLGFALAGVLAVVVGIAIRRSRAGASERATVLLLAGLSLVDASLLATRGHVVLALLAIAAMPLTRKLQRFVRGT
jgi:4-hydroxybenzoate polyprenyltransferase